MKLTTGLPIHAPMRVDRRGQGWIRVRHTSVAVLTCVALVACGKAGGEDCDANEECASGCCITGLSHVGVEFSDYICSNSPPESYHVCIGDSSGSSGESTCRQNVAGCDPSSWSCDASPRCYVYMSGCEDSGECPSSGGSGTSSGSCETYERCADAAWQRGDDIEGECGAAPDACTCRRCVVDHLLLEEICCCAEPPCSD